MCDEVNFYPFTLYHLCFEAFWCVDCVFSTFRQGEYIYIYYILYYIIYIIYIKKCVCFRFILLVHFHLFFYEQCSVLPGSSCLRQVWAGPVLQNMYPVCAPMAVLSGMCLVVCSSQGELV